MDAETITEISVESCNVVYDYIEHMQHVDPEIGRVVTKVNSYQIKGNYVILHVGRKIADTSMMGLYIRNKVFYDDDVNFDQFDEISLTVTIYPSKRVMELLLSGRPELHIVVDLKWLINRTRDYYEDHGQLIGYPKVCPHFEPHQYDFPKGLVPTEQQRDAVQTILNSELTYVWGAPGTGKTQFVLATAILAYLRKGKKVAILAPTNNSLEQVLRGLLKIIKNDDPEGKLVDLDKDILRLGVATADFFKEFPNICEKRGIDALINSAEETWGVLNDVIFERDCEILKAHFDEISVLYNEEYDRAGYFEKKKILSQIKKYFDEIKKVLMGDKRFSELVIGVDEYNLRTKAKEISFHLYNRPRPASDIKTYKEWTREDLEAKKAEIEAELDKLRVMHPVVKTREAKILAMTPQVFMGRFAPPESFGMKLDVDHIFVDEVGYCNLVNTLPLFSCGVPITMLGDHMQLPPVCEIEENVLLKGISKGNTMRYAFMWDQPALFAESYLFGDVDTVQRAYENREEAQFKRTARVDLTQSHRFGDNLAKILDECIYRNGITGEAKAPLDIVCIDAVCDSKDGRENRAEVDAIGKFLKQNPMEPEKFAILTPYKDQVSLLSRTYPDIKDNILTVHKSQGREWDTVILSISDNRVANKDVPLRFTSTLGHSSVGTKVINTAVSRAKKRLVIVCDREFWSKMEGELVGRLVS